MSKIKGPRKSPIAEIRLKIAETLKQLNRTVVEDDEPVYFTHLPVGHIYPKFTREVAEIKNDATYPKCFIVSDEGSFERLPAGQKHNKYDFLILFFAKSIKAGDDPDIEAENFAADLEKLFDRNDTLGGTVQDVVCQGYTTSSGFTFPEGVCVCQISVETYSNG